MVMSVDVSKIGQQKNSSANGMGQGAGSQGLSQTMQANRAAAKNGEHWTVPAWQKGFDLVGAKAQAYAAAQSHMNKILSLDDLQVSLAVNEEEPATSTQEVTALVQEAGHQKGESQGKTIKTYNGLEVLRLFTHNTKPKGVIADGAV